MAVNRRTPGFVPVGKSLLVCIHRVARFSNEGLFRLGIMYREEDGMAPDGRHFLRIKQEDISTSPKELNVILKTGLKSLTVESRKKRNSRLRWRRERASHAARLRS
jgi:hypothetical protein